MTGPSNVDLFEAKRARLWEISLLVDTERLPKPDLNAEEWQEFTTLLAWYRRVGVPFDAKHFARMTKACDMLRNLPQPDVELIAAIDADLLHYREAVSFIAHHQPTPIEAASHEGRVVGLLDAMTAIVMQLEAMDALDEPEPCVEEALADLRATLARAGITQPPAIARNTR